MIGCRLTCGKLNYRSSLQPEGKLLQEGSPPVEGRSINPMITRNEIQLSKALSPRRGLKPRAMRPVLASLCFIIFAAAMLLLPDAMQRVSAARGAQGGKQRASNASVRSAALLVPLKPAAMAGKGSNALSTTSAGEPSPSVASPAQNRSNSNNEEDDPDLPPFARGVIDKETYLTRREENISFLRGLPYTTGTNPRLKAIQEMQRQRDLNAPNILSGTWTEIGPAPLPNGQTESVSTPVSGRTVAIDVHPTNPSIAYVGAAQGGVYRTTDGGNTWKAIFDSAQSLAAGSIAIAPSQPTTVYVGTGEPGGSPDSFFGVGLYKITNAENVTPTLTGPLNPGGIFTGRAIGNVIVHPTDPNIIFVTTASGIGGLNGEPFGGGTVPPLPAGARLVPLDRWRYFLHEDDNGNRDERRCRKFRPQ
jgi:hypothetical protein